MGFITDIIKDLPLSAVQAERLALAEDRKNFEVVVLTARAEKAETERDQCHERLKGEQADHAVNRKLLDEARAEIDRLSAGPRRIIPEGGYGDDYFGR